MLTPSEQEVRVVEEVEDLEPQLDLRLREGTHGLVEREVGLEQAGSTALASLLVANRPELEADQRERRRIENLFRVRVATGPAIAVRGHVRLMVAVARSGRPVVQTRQPAGVHRQRLA